MASDARSFLARPEAIFIAAMSFLMLKTNPSNMMELLTQAFGDEALKLQCAKLISVVEELSSQGDSSTTHVAS